MYTFHTCVRCIDDARRTYARSLSQCYANRLDACRRRHTVSYIDTSGNIHTLLHSILFRPCWRCSPFATARIVGGNYAVAVIGADSAIQFEECVDVEASNGCQVVHVCECVE